MKLGASVVVLPASVASVPVPLMAEVPVQLNAPDTLMFPLPVSVPPLIDSTEAGPISDVSARSRLPAVIASVSLPVIFTLLASCPLFTVMV